MVELNMDRNFLYFDAVSYKSQVVAGTNYEVKYAVGMNEFIVVRIFDPLPNTNAVPEFKTLVSDTIEKSTVYKGNAVFVKTCMFTAVSAAALMLA